MQESIFDLEVREKKNQAFANKAKTGAKGGSKSRKGMRTPSDFLTNREKMKLNGEVRTHNMYETILNWNDWELKDRETQKNLLTRWREIYPNTKIMEELAIGRGKPFNSQSFADIVNDLGVPPKRKGGSLPRKARQAKMKDTAELPKKSLLEFALDPKEEMKEAIQEEVVKTMLISKPKGLHLEYNGDYDVEALNRLFTKLQLLVDGEPNKYKISLTMTEIVE